MQTVQKTTLAREQDVTQNWCGLGKVRPRDLSDLRELPARFLPDQKTYPKRGNCLSKRIEDPIRPLILSLNHCTTVVMTAIGANHMRRNGCPTLRTVLQLHWF